MKKLLSIVLALLFVVSVVSCTVTPIETTTPGESTAATEVTASTTDSSSTTAESTTAEPTTTESTTTPGVVIPDDPDDLIEQLPDNEEFAEFVKSYFIEAMMGDNADVWNSLFDDPASFGYERDEEYVPSFPTYSSIDEAKEDIEYFEDALKELEKYDYNQLNRNQQIEYRQIKFQSEIYLKLLNATDSWAILALTSYISPYGGTVAEAFSTLENYKYKRQMDVDDVVSYIQSSTDAFASYITYGEDRIKLGFELPDTTIDAMIDFLDDIIEQGEDYYIYGYLAKQINAIEFLTDEQKADYIAKINDGLTNVMFPALVDLKEKLPSLKGHFTGETMTSVAYYGEKAKGYLEYKLAIALNTEDFNIDDYGAELKAMLKSSESEYNTVVKKIQSKGENFINKFLDDLDTMISFLGCTSDEELLDFCLKYAKNVVYPLPNEPEISLKYTDESIGEVASYVAYYTLSPVDNRVSLTEYITTNPAKISSFSDALTTLAHEGYPGHLYAHVYAKQKGLTYYTILNSHSGSEAWAQYASYTLLKSAAKTFSNNYYKFECDYLAALMKYNYVYSCYLDYVCNYMGLDVEGVMDVLGCTRKEALSYIDYCEDNVAGLVGYGYAFAKMCSIHDDVKRKTEGFVEQDFNRYIMNNNGLESISRYEELAKLYVQP